MNHLFQLAVTATALFSQIIVTESLTNRICVPLTSRIDLLRRSQPGRTRFLRSYEIPNIRLHSSETDDESFPVADNESGMEDEDNYMGSNQYDEYEMAGQPADAEMIEAMRLERIIANDRWQSCLIRDKQGGEWTG